MKTVSIIICLVALGFLIQCSGRQPREEREAFKSHTIDHTRFTKPCTSCHETDRPSLAIADGKDSDELTEDDIHGYGGNCVLCHEYDEDKPWKTVSFDHPKKIETCLSCHETARPSRSSHPQDGDCQNCHNTDEWLPLK